MKNKNDFIIVNRDKLTSATAELTSEIVAELDALSAEQGSPQKHIGEVLLLAMYSARLCDKLFNGEEETESTENESEVTL